MNQSYPTFPTNPQYSQAPQMAYPNAQNMQSHGPGAMMMPQDLASIQQQGYMQQQQQLAQAQAQMMARGYASSSSSTPAHKKKKPPRPSPQAQMMPRHTQHLGPPHLSEHYLKHAMSGPGDIEPWADALDEVDPREMAMGRFRARQGILGEVFGPETIQEIPIEKGDPWAGLGMDGETLEAKVQALEAGNAELEGKMDSELEGFLQRL